MTDVELTNLRRDRIGFIFQYFNLFPLLNIIENVSFPQMLKSGKGGVDRHQTIIRLDGDAHATRPVTSACIT